MNYFIAEIPIKSHLKQFALILENKEGDEVLDIKKGGVICYVLRMMLQGKMQIPHRGDYTLNANYDNRLRFKIPRNMLYRGQICIGAQNTVIFNQFIHKLLNELLLDRIAIAIQRYEKKEIDVIRDFLEEFKIDELVEWDTVKKSKNRLKKAKQKASFTVQSVPSPETQ